MRFILLILTFLINLSAFSQCIDSTAFFVFKDEKIECIKRYCLSGYDDFGDPIDPIYTLSRCIIKDAEKHTIKVFPHFQYIFSNQYDEYGNSEVIGKIKDTILDVDFFIKKTAKDSLIKVLLNPIFINDFRGVKSIVNFKIIISSRDDYLSISKSNSQWREILIYELNNLNKGDYVVLSNIHFRDKNFIPIWLTENMYWEIE